MTTEQNPDSTPTPEDNRGKVLQVFQARIVLRERNNLSYEDFMKIEGGQPDPIPTAKALAEFLQGALYDELAYFTDDVINVTVEIV